MIVLLLIAGITWMSFQLAFKALKQSKGISSSPCRVGQIFSHLACALIAMQSCNRRVEAQAGKGLADLPAKPPITLPSIMLRTFLTFGFTIAVFCVTWPSAMMTTCITNHELQRHAPSPYMNLMTHSGRHCNTLCHPKLYVMYLITLSDAQHSC